MMHAIMGCKACFGFHEIASGELAAEEQLLARLDGVTAEGGLPSVILSDALEMICTRDGSCFFTF